MIKNLWINVLILGVVLVIGALVVAYHPINKSEDEIKVGSILPLTGSFADIGEDVNRGALIAVDEVKSQGLDVAYIPEDDAFDPKKELSAGNKLLQVDHVESVFTLAGEEEKPLANLFNDAAVPLLIAWDSNESLKTAGPSIFSIGFASEANGARMADYAYDTLGIRRLSIVEVVDPVATYIISGLNKEFVAKGGQIVLDEKIQPDAQDMRTSALKAMSIPTDGIYVVLFPPQHSILFPQLRQLGYKGYLLAGDSLIQSEIDGAGAAAEGVYFTKTYADKEQEIISKYKTRYGTVPVDPVLVSFGYDAFMTLVEAHKIALAKRLSVTDALKMVKFDGLGTTIDMHGMQFSDRVEKVFEVVRGKPVLAQ